MSVCICLPGSKWLIARRRRSAAARRLTILAARLGLMDVVLRAAESEAGLRRALFDAASAHRPYRDVIREGLTPASVSAVAAAFFQPGQRQT